MAIFKRNVFETSLTHYMNDSTLEILQNVVVGIAGAGGLGSNIAHAIVRMGVCNFVVCDFDKVEGHNLNRQNYTIDDIGKYKVCATADILKKINSHINIKTYTEKITEENIVEIFANCDIVFEAFDSAECKKMMLEKLYDSGKILVFGNGLAGIEVINSPGLKIKNVGKNIFIVGDNQTGVDKNNPPFAPKVMATASLMAGVGIEAIIKKG